MYNDLFSIGPFTVHMYGLMTAIGIISAYLFAEHRTKKKGLGDQMVDLIFGLVISCVVVGYAGSKLLYLLTILPQLTAGTMSIKDAITNGWVVFGGLLGGILGAALYCKWKKADFLLFTDIAMPAVALAQGFGRIGCFFAGCCYGAETHSHWFFTRFTNSGYAPNNVNLVPTQLIMSAGDFLLCFGLLLYEKKVQKFKGDIMALYLIFYSIGRFIVEFWRGDLIRGQVGVLSTSQFIGLFTAAVGLALLIWIHVRKPADVAAENAEETAETAEEASDSVSE